MFNLSALYHPLTARPAHANEFRPCTALQPYIRCFWGPASSVEEHQPSVEHKEIIIPDTCMDIIWELNEATGSTSIYFCGMNDTPFEIIQEPGRTRNSRFAIRFYFWAVHFFADNHLREVLNANTDVEHYFSTFRQDLSHLLEKASTMTERIAAAEAYLLIRLERLPRSNDNLMNAVYTIIKYKGVVTVKELEANTGLSSRQLERIFQEYTGVSPKKTADLVRFQNAWQDLYLAADHSCVQDIVYSYQYSHQSHFINKFKQYAGRTPLEALKYARR